MPRPRDPTNAVDKFIGARVRMRRKMLGKSQTALAEAMGLTSVRQPVDDLARAALAAVFDGIHSPQHVELESTLVLRASTA